MKPWWIWRLNQPVKFLDLIELDWDYRWAKDDNATWIDGRQGWGRDPRSTAILDAYFAGTKLRNRWSRPMGEIFTLTVFAERRKWILTPPIYRFADSRVEFGERALADGDPLFWIQPEVFEEFGQIMQGDNPGAILDVLMSDVLGSEVGEFVKIALDAFLESGRPDPRFGGAPSMDPAAQLPAMPKRRFR